MGFLLPAENLWRTQQKQEGRNEKRKERFEEVAGESENCKRREEAKEKANKQFVIARA